MGLKKRFIRTLLPCQSLTTYATMINVSKWQFNNLSYLNPHQEIQRSWWEGWGEAAWTKQNPTPYPQVTSPQWPVFSPTRPPHTHHAHPSRSPTTLTRHAHPPRSPVTLTHHTHPSRSPLTHHAHPSRSPTTLTHHAHPTRSPISPPLTQEHNFFFCDLLTCFYFTLYPHLPRLSRGEPNRFTVATQFILTCGRSVFSASEQTHCALVLCDPEWIAHSEHRFPAPSSTLCLIWLRHWRGTLYLRADVHRRGQRPK